MSRHRAAALDEGGAMGHLMQMSPSPRGITPPLSIAPMMDRTDRHYRFMMRQITRRTLLYTEMVVARAILNGDRERLLGFDPVEHPVALQLGGDDPERLARCAQIAEEWGYDEVNLNVGCPSSRVRDGAFGASLMKRPERVAEAVAAMRARVAIPVTVKHRIGVDELDAYEDMVRFVEIVRAAGADRFTVHARKAWLQGLSPKENRNIPPLRHAEVWRLKRDFPELSIEINGGIRGLDAAEEHLQHVDAVMIGRAAYDLPWLFAAADSRIFGEEAEPPRREEVVHAMADYTARWADHPHFKLSWVSRHLLNLYAGQPGARRWRRVLTEQGAAPGAGPEVLLRALDAVQSAEIAA